MQLLDTTCLSNWFPCYIHYKRSDIYEGPYYYWPFAKNRSRGHRYEQCWSHIIIQSIGSAVDISVAIFVQCGIAGVCFMSSRLTPNYCTLIKLNVILSHTSEFMQKVKMSRRRTSAYGNVDYQKVQEDDNEFIDSQVGIL